MKRRSEAKVESSAVDINEGSISPWAWVLLAGIPILTAIDVAYTLSKMM